MGMFNSSNMQKHVIFWPGLFPEACLGIGLKLLGSCFSLQAGIQDSSKKFWKY